MSASPSRPGRPRSRAQTSDEEKKQDDGLTRRFEQFAAQLSAQMTQMMAAQMSQMMSAITGLSNQVSGLNTRMDVMDSRVTEQFQKVEAQLNGHMPSPSPGAIPPPVSASSTSTGNSSTARVVPVSEKEFGRQPDIKLFGRSVSSIPTAGPKLTSTEVDKYIRWSKDFRAHAVWQGVSEYIQWPAHRVIDELEVLMPKQARTEVVKRLVASRCRQVTAMIWSAVAEVIPDLGTIVSSYYATHSVPPDPCRCCYGRDIHLSSSTQA